MLKFRQNESVEIFVYLKDKEISLWRKCYLWHKWMPKTPKGYADAVAKVLKQKPDYGPCFWGMHEESPEEKGYRLIGKLDEIS